MHTIIITHGNLARELLDTANKLLPQPLRADIYSNQTLQIDDIVNDVLLNFKRQENKALFVFTDFRGGSCWQAAYRIKHEVPSTTIISGINIPMLISFGANMDSLQGDALIQKITEDAIKSIQIF